MLCLALFAIEGIKKNIYTDESVSINKELNLKLYSANKLHYIVCKRTETIKNETNVTYYSVLVQSKLPIIDPLYLFSGIPSQYIGSTDVCSEDNIKWVNDTVIQIDDKEYSLEY